MNIKRGDMVVYFGKLQKVVDITFAEGYAHIVQFEVNGPWFLANQCVKS